MERAQLSSDTTAARQAVMRNSALRAVEKPAQIERAERIAKLALSQGKTTLAKILPDQLSPEQQREIAELAAQLPPLTADQAAEAGRLAARLDQRAAT